MNRIDVFWEKFQKNSESYYHISDIDKEIKDLLMDDLLNILHEYCDRLFYEIGEDPDNPTRELIITAEGQKEYFDKVKELVNRGPAIEKWQFYALIPPKGVDFTTNYEGIFLDPKEMWFLPLENVKRPKSLGIRVGISNYDELKGNVWLRPALKKIIMEVIGEKSFAEDIQHLDFGELPKLPEIAGFIEVKELSDYLTWKKSKIY